MYKITFKSFGKQVFAPKSNFHLYHWQKDKKKARLFPNEFEAQEAVYYLKHIITVNNSTEITDIKIIPA